MEKTSMWQDKRLLYAALATVLIFVITFFSQSVNQIIWIGLSGGLQQIGTVITLDNLANLGNVILLTIVSAMGWYVGFTVILYVAFVVLGILLIVLYRKAMRKQGVSARWFDYLFMIITGFMSFLPLAILLASIGFFSVYALNTLQAFNSLSNVSVEPLLATWNSLLEIITNFTLTPESIQAIIDLIPQISSAFANFGDIITIWNQTVSFLDQLQVTNATLEISKLIGIVIIIISDIGLVYAIMLAMPDSPLPKIQLVPRPTPPVSSLDESETDQK